MAVRGRVPVGGRIPFVAEMEGVQRAANRSRQRSQFHKLGWGWVGRWGKGGYTETGSITQFCHGCSNRTLVDVAAPQHLLATQSLACLHPLPALGICHPHGSKNPPKNNRIMQEEDNAHRSPGLKGVAAQGGHLPKPRGHISLCGAEASLGT